MPRPNTRLSGERVFSTQFATDSRFADSVDELRKALMQARQYLQAVDLLRDAVAAAPGRGQEGIPAAVASLLSSCRRDRPNAADMVTLRAELQNAKCWTDLVVSRLKSLGELPQTTTESLRLLSQINTPGKAVPAKMLVAGRLIERGWLLSKRGLTPRPHQPAKLKSILIQIDRVVWSEISREQAMSGIPLKDLATMYLGLGLSWPAEDLPLTLSEEGYTALLPPKAA